VERASLARPWSAREHREGHPIFVSALLATSASHTQERSQTVFLPHPQRCLPRPRKRGALHDFVLCQRLWAKALGCSLGPFHGLERASVREGFAPELSYESHAEPGRTLI
jgi:hypothetical protein